MNVKRITIKGIICRIDDHSHEEKFTLTPNSISFTCKHEIYNPFAEDLNSDWYSQSIKDRDENDPEVIEWKRMEWARHQNWSYKTNHPDFQKDFVKISDIVKDLIENEQYFESIPECRGQDSFLFTVVFEDGHKISKVFFEPERFIGEHFDEYFDDCFKLLFRWVPKHETVYSFDSAFSSYMKADWDEEKIDEE